jgi:hypothetical protein
MEESLSEKEPGPPEGGQAVTGQSGQAEAPSASPKKNKVMRLIKEMWPAYLIEIFVIILGISITLAMEEWRDAGRERELEQIYLKNLATDVELDLRTLADVSAATQKILDHGNDLLARIKDPAKHIISIDQLGTDVRAILGRPKFESNDATFSDLKSSGNLHLLKDIRLKQLLFAYYNLARDIRDDQDAEQQATITLSGSYFLKEFPLDAFGERSTGPGSRVPGELSKSIEFDNNVLLRVTTRKELLDLYQRADSSAVQLRGALTAALTLPSPS